MAYIEFDDDSPLSDDEKVLVLVLSYLPTKLAMATSVISKEFRYRWEKIFRIDFDDRGHGGNSEEFMNGCFNTWMRINPKRLDKLRLFVGKICDPGFLPQFTKFAITCKVRFLDLNALGVTPEAEIKLPASLYKRESLVSLELVGTFCVESPEDTLLPNLKRLKLIEVMYEVGDSLTRLVSGCPSLQSLHLVMSRKSDRKELDITISSPKLTYLDLLAHPSDSIKLRVPSLVEAKVGVMTLSNLAFEGLGYETDRWPIFGKLTKLVVKTDCSQWGTLFEILKRSPKLEVLIFEKNPCRCSVHVDWIRPEEVPGCFSSTLKQVSISGYQGFEDETAVMEYILKHGGTLWKEVQFVSRQTLV